jgi:putative drug exporter of the RND superfamily
MIHLARLSIRRPGTALAAWLVVAVVLSLIGLGVSSHVSPSLVVVAGSQSSRAEHLTDERFGPSVLAPVLLEGPQAKLDARGPAVVRALARRSDTRVLSAWDRGEAGEALRPEPTAAMIVVSVARTPEEMAAHVQGEIERTVSRTAGPELQARYVGTAVLDRAMKDEVVAATQRAEAIAVGILFVLLLVLLRAPVAAGVLTLMGAGTAFSGLGIMAVLGEFIEVDATAIALGSMTGLALGVGYGLMVYRRFREEFDPQTHHPVTAAQAASRAVLSSGRAVLLGGTALVLSLVVATLIAPTTILTSLGVGVLLCSLVGVGAAVVVVPAAIVVLGRRLEALSFGLPGPIARAWDRALGGGWVASHAVGAGFVATMMLFLLAIPALALETGPPSPSLLPAGSQARQDFERVGAVMGEGWATPYNVVVVSQDGPITDPELLKDLNRFQTRIARDRAVVSVVGPGAFAAQTAPLMTLPNQLEDSAELLEGGKDKLGELSSGLGEAAAGALKLQEGLKSAASGAGRLEEGSGTLQAGTGRLGEGSGEAQAGAGRLSEGSGEAQAGAGLLEENLEKARVGADKIEAGLEQALNAAVQLRDGSAAALEGSQQLAGGLGEVAPKVSDGLPAISGMAGNVQSGSSAVESASASAADAISQLDAALAELGGAPGTDSVRAARDALEAASAQLAAAGPGLQSAAAVSGAFEESMNTLSVALAQLNQGSTALAGGIAQLQDGNARLADGIERLRAGEGELAAGVTALRNGAAALEAGLGQLTAGALELSAGQGKLTAGALALYAGQGKLGAGAAELGSGLSSGVDPAGELAAGLGFAGSEVAKFRSELPSPKQLEQLQESSPGLFDSGYFVLAAVEGAPPPERRMASFLVNLEGGGDAGQITVVSRAGIESNRTQALGKRLRVRAERLAEQTGTEVAIGGPAGDLTDFEQSTLARLWPAVAGVALAVALLLMVALRSVLIPAVAVAFDLLTAAAAFGIMTLAFSGNDPLLGGTGYIDPMSIVGLFAVVFGLTMVYEVLLLGRARDRFLRTGDPDLALRHGLRRTAAAATGAALVMIAAVIPFATADLLAVRQFAVGVAAVVLLDALIVRPVLLPAAVEILGRAGWWPSSRHAPHPPETPEAPPTERKQRFTPPAGAPGGPAPAR